MKSKVLLARKIFFFIQSIYLPKNFQFNHLDFSCQCLLLKDFEIPAESYRKFNNNSARMVCQGTKCSLLPISARISE